MGTDYAGRGIAADRWRGRSRRTRVAGGAVGLLALITVPVVASAAADSTALVMGGSGISIPPPNYLDSVNDLYLQCGPPSCSLQGLAAPQGLYPLIGGPKGLPFDPSVTQGVAVLNNAITRQLAAGHDVTVFGYSQGATIASMQMADIENGSTGIHPGPGQLEFVLVGDPSNPNGGLLSRFDLPGGSHPSIPTLGMTFSGATPVTEFPTTIYTAEYDPVADFPRYPLNLLADLNALLGFVFVHTQYPGFTADQLDAAIKVPTSAGYDGATDYYVIPTEHLPLLDPLRSIPVVGPVLSDLFEPNLRVLVNLGYGDPEYGWVNHDAEVATPVGVFPGVDELAKVPGLMLAGTLTGFQNALNDLAAPAQLFSLDGNPLLKLLETQYFWSVASQDITIPAAPGDGLIGVVNAISAAASSLYGNLLPAADIGTALLVTLPVNAANIFADQLERGDLLGAIGLPMAASTGLAALAGLFGIGAIAEGFALAGLDLLSPFVDIDAMLQGF